MALGPGTIFSPPRRLPSVGGLFDTFEPITMDGGHWELGYEIESPGCGVAARRAVNCPPADMAGVSSPPSVLEFAPVEAQSEFSCSTFGFEAANYQERAMDILRRWIQNQAEAELWTGDAALAASLTSGFLTNPIDLDILASSDPVPLPYALAQLQEAIAACLGGEAGVIHATRKTVSLWQMSGAVFREGDHLVDVFGNYIIAGTGYDGSSPYELEDEEIVPDSSTIDATGDTAWAYATGALDVRVGPAILIPDTMAEALDRAVNLVVFRGAQTVSSAFDPCCRIGINVDLCSTCCVPAG